MAFNIREIKHNSLNIREKSADNLVFSFVFFPFYAVDIKKNITEKSKKSTDYKHKSNRRFFQQEKKDKNCK
jgi:hypothetical protein